MRWLLALVFTLALSACPIEQDSPQSCAHAVTQDLDAGRYDFALERLDTRACEAGMTAEEREINRAAAYIGKAGYDVADVLLVVLPPTDANSDAADLRLLQGLIGLGERNGGMRYLSRANAAYGRMMGAFAGGLDEACQAINVTLLSPLQRDACFFSGLLAYARLVRGFDLLLQHQLEAFLGLQPLTCSNDSNFTGVVDAGEIAACAITASSRLNDREGTCRAPGQRAGQATGAVRWERLASFPELTFFEQGTQFATLVPIRITVEPGGPCTTGRDEIRLLQPAPGTRAQLAMTDGYCETEITWTCDAADPAARCWPCPIPRAGGGTGATSAADALLDPVNLEAERWSSVLPPEDDGRVAGELDELRETLCEPSARSSAECERDGERVQITPDTLREYLRR